MQFTETLNALRAKKRALALDFVTHVASLTPYGTGQAKANWWTTVGAPRQRPMILKKKERLTAVAAEAISIGRVHPLPPAPKGDIYVVNPLSYAKELEDGSAKQAAAAMVAVSVQALIEENR